MAPVAALEMTETAVPGISRSPRTPVGVWKVSWIEGQSRPRMELGTAVARYARQARNRVGTARTSSESLEVMPAGLAARSGAPGQPADGLAVPHVRAARDDRSVTYCVSACSVFRALQLLEGLSAWAGP
jgi:hypothetical protein